MTGNCGFYYAQNADGIRAINYLPCKTDQDSLCGMLYCQHRERGNNYAVKRPPHMVHYKRTVHDTGYVCIVISYNAGWFTSRL